MNEDYVYVNGIVVRVGDLLGTVLPIGMVVGRVAEVGRGVSEKHGDTQIHWDPYVKLVDVVRIRETVSRDRQSIEVSLQPMIAGVDSVNVAVDKVTCTLNLKSDLLEGYKAAMREQKARDAGLILPGANDGVPGPPNPQGGPGAGPGLKSV